MGRVVTLETNERGIAVLTFDVPGAPMNALDERALADLEACSERIGSDPAVKAAVLAGKADNFVVGADISTIQGLATEADGRALSRRAQAVFGALEALRKPVVAAIHGPALGGGLELALACHYRIATASAETSLGLPEVKLGLLPGAGGTQRLPRVMPLQDAMEALLTGKAFSADKALALGLVDEVVLPHELRQRALAAAEGLAAGTLAPRRKPPALPPASALPAVYEQAKAKIAGESKGLYPAPLSILECVYAGLTRGFEDGLAEESERFAKLAVSPQASSLIHLFFAERGTKKDRGPAAGVKPLPVRKVAVLGAGLMGHGIAAVKANAGLLVRMKDRDPASAGMGLKAAADILQGMWKKRPRGEFEFRRRFDLLSATGDYSGFREADVCIEAVFEDLELKHRVIREVEAVLPERAVVASNTSAIPIARLAAASRRPDRFLGMHYFSPVHRMPLIEVIVTKETSPEALATALRLCELSRKTPLVVNDGVGFFTTRVIARYLQEAVFLLEEGARTEEVDEAAVRVGFPVGPLVVADEVGLETAAKVMHVVDEVFRDRFAASPLIAALVAQGRRGKRNERGFYLYGPGRKEPDSAVYDRTAPGSRRVSPEADEIADRLLLAFASEAVLCLQEDVLRSPRDGDVGSVFGIGFPPNLGGPFHYLDARGIRPAVDRLRRYEERFGGRFAPPRLLVEMAQAGRRFFPGG